MLVWLPNDSEETFDLVSKMVDFCKNRSPLRPSGTTPHLSSIRVVIKGSISEQRQKVRIADTCYVRRKWVGSVERTLIWLEVGVWLRGP